MDWKIDDSSLPSHYRIVVAGEVVVAECIEMWTELLGHPKWQNGSAVIFDMRKRTLTPAAGVELHDKLLKFLAKNRSRVDACRIGVITNNQSYFGQRSFKYGLRLRDLTTQFTYFQNEAAAEKWLRSNDSLATADR